MLLSRFNNFLEKLTKHAESVDTPFVLFGIYQAVNYLSDFAIFHYIFGESDIWIKTEIIAFTLCIILALKKYWPNFLKRGYTFFWYGFVIWSLPYLETYRILESTSNATTLFNLDTVYVLFLLILILDWKGFFIITILGVGLGILAKITFGHINIQISNYQPHIVSLIWCTLMATFFSRNSFRTRTNRIRQEQEVAQKIANLSAQVAHDIRSPLAALQILTEQQLLELPESKRILLRDAVHQIRDITNNLDQNAIKNEKTVTQVAVLLENVLSERRAAFVNKSIEFKENIPLESYGYFSNLIPSEIKRVITNIINNAVEAMNTSGGIVNLNLKKSADQIVIEIADNGAGIPKEILDALFARGFTTKKTGSGLGLFHAKETLIQLGGGIDMTSEVGKGTTVSLLLPACEPPEWFIDKLEVPDHSILVCVDDSVSIWNVWQERFQSMTHNIELRYCADKEALLAQLREQSEKPYTYLIDYEFSGKLYTGLDLIKLVLKFKKMNDQVYLVTSRSGESNIHQFCRENEVKMIPKFFALMIGVEVR